MFIPTWLLRRSEQRGRFLEFCGPERVRTQRITAEPLNTLENCIKVRRKQLDALHDDALMARKADDQAKLMAKIAADPALKAELGDPFADIAKAEDQGGLWSRYTYLERGVGFESQLFDYARTLVRAAAERAKPNEQRLREYTEAALPRLEQQLGAPVPVYPQLERMTDDAGTGAHARVARAR